MLISIISNTWWCMSFGVSCNFMDACDVSSPKPWKMLCHNVIQADGMPLSDVMAI